MPRDATRPRLPDLAARLDRARGRCARGGPAAQRDHLRRRRPALAHRDAADRAGDGGAARARASTSRNSHSLFPTFTTPNASAIATGHLLGDTGDFGNTIYAGFPSPARRRQRDAVLEDDPVLGDVDEHFAGNYLGETTLLQAARDKGYATAAIGKLGPT